MLEQVVATAVNTGGYVGRATVYPTLFLLTLEPLPNTNPLFQSNRVPLPTVVFATTSSGLVLSH